MGSVTALLSVDGTSNSSAGAATERHTKLQQAAQQFEACMLGELLKPLASGNEEDGSSSGPLQSYGVEALAGAMARSGGLGFASRIVHSVESHDAGTVSENTSEAS